MALSLAGQPDERTDNELRLSPGKLGPEIGPRLHRTQPNSLDVIRSIGRDSALWTGSGATHNPWSAGSSPARPIERTVVIRRRLSRQVTVHKRSRKPPILNWPPPP